MGVPQTIRLKINARYITSYNINVDDGICNGASGTLKRIDLGHNSAGQTKPLRLWIKFNDRHVGTKTRSRYKRIMRRHKIPKRWTPLEPIIITIKTKKNSSLQIKRKQFGITVAHALTIHKSQGDTEDLVYVHFKRRMRRDLSYVACSRAKTAEGLKIVGQFTAPSPIQNTDLLYAEMKRWRSCPIIPTFKFLRSHHGSCLQILFHNIQSLPRYAKIISNDKVYKKSHLILLAETWTDKKYQYNFNSFSEVVRSDSKYITRKPRGVWILNNDIISSDINTSGSRIFKGKHSPLELCWTTIYNSGTLCTT